MKNIITILAIITIVINVNAQTHWTKKQNFPGVKRNNPVAFNIENKGYAGVGIDTTATKNLKDFWEYNSLINVWTKKSDYPSSSNFCGFAIDKKGYMLAGGFYEYNPINDVWLNKSTNGDGNKVTFVIDGKGYTVNSNGVGCYNPTTNTWTNKALFPGFQRSGGVAFGIGNKGYYGMGFNLGPFSDFWEYNPTTNTWRELDKYTLNTTGSGIGFSMNGKGYIAAGSDFFYEYNPSLNTWKKLDSIPVKGSVGFAFSVNNKAYVYLNNTNQDNFWEYDPKEVRLQAITTTKLNCFVDSVTLQYQIVPFKNHVITAQLAAEGTQFANPIILTTFTDSTGIANKKIALPSGLNTNQVYEIRLISNFGDTSSTEKLVLNLIPRKLTISKVNNTQLTCNGSAGNSYIWLLNGQSVGITNATKPNLTITQNGYYQVLFDSLGCKTLSDSFNVNFVGLAETQKQILSSIYPNPNNGEFTLTFNQNNEPKTIEILDALGKLQATFITNNQTYQAQLNHLAKGIYFVKINTPNTQQMVKLLIE